MAEYGNNRGGGNAEKKKPKAPMDWSKMSLSTPTPGMDNAWSSFVVDVAGIAKQIRLTIWTNIPDDKENGGGKITTQISVPSWFAFLAQLQQVIASKTEIKLSVAGLNWYGYGGKRGDTPKLETELFVGKDAEGVMYILLTAPKRPKLVFHFEPKLAGGQFHEFRTNTGEPLDRASSSLMYARGYHALWSKILEMDMISELLRLQKPNDYEPPFVFQGAGGGAGGGNRSGGAGGYQRGGGGGSGGGAGYGERRDAAPAARTQVTMADAMDDDVPY